MSVDGQGTKCRRNIVESSNRLSRAHERYRQTTDRQSDGRATAYSERERDFTFPKNKTVKPNESGDQRTVHEWQIAFSV